METGVRYSICPYQKQWIGSTIEDILVCNLAGRKALRTEIGRFYDELDRLTSTAPKTKVLLFVIRPDEKRSGLKSVVSMMSLKGF
jgi:hypothetical protein